MPPLILPKIEQQKRNEKSPQMKHTRHQNHRPTTAANTKGAVIPGYTGKILKWLYRLLFKKGNTVTSFAVTIGRLSSFTPESVYIIYMSYIIYYI